MGPLAHLLLQMIVCMHLLHTDKLDQRTTELCPYSEVKIGLDV